MHALSSSFHADERNSLGVGERPVDERVEQGGILAVQVRSHGHDDVPAGEHLSPREVAVVFQDLRQDLACIAKAHRLRCRLRGIHRGGEALDRPAGSCELRPPPPHELSLFLVLFGRSGGAGGDSSRSVGPLAPALALCLDLGRPLRMERQHLVGDAGDPPVPEPP